MKKLILLAFLVTGGLTVQSCGSEKKDSTERAEDMNEQKVDDKMTSVTDDGAEFAVKAASGGMLEVAAGKMAEEKGMSQAVKDFGAMLVKDHTKANEELKSIATSKNINLPSTMGEEQQKHIDELAKLSGKEFDKKFVDMMADDHEDDMDLFEKASKDVKDPDLKSFATQTASVIKGHLERVTTLQKDMK
jgi:putative membrane protein